MHVSSAVPSSSARLFAWIGAALFALSLVYFLLSYATTFGTPAAGGDLAAPITWNVALFSIFALHHSVFARTRVRRWIARLVPAELERSFYVWVASLLFIAVCALWRPLPGIAWQAEGALLWVLRLLQGAGAWLTLRSAALLDVRELAGLRFRKPEGFPLPGEGGRDMAYKTSGPYGWVRHPIYSGWFLMVFAASPMTTTRLVFAIVSGAYLLMAIPFEERSMRASGTGAYDRYAAQVRWKLLPGVY